MKKKLLHSIFLTIAIVGFINSVNGQTIAAGGGHILSICTNGTAKSWGLNGFGQLGNATNTGSSSPVDISALTDLKEIQGDMSIH